MAPIRVGLMGLSTSTNSKAPGAWAWSAHLPYLIDSKKYQIVALCNSIKQAAEASIAYHQLGSHVKAYGDPTDLAMDPDVDLVVISVTIMKHYELARPSLLAGKDVFVEWPIASTIAEAGELTDWANTRGARTLVGLQARADPLLLKIKELVDNGKIGKVISSTVVGFFTVPVDIWPQSAACAIDMTSGGNTFTINCGHFYDSFKHVLGGFAEMKSIIKAQYPMINIVNAAGDTIVHDHLKTAPDHVFIQGILEPGALASISFRTVTSTIDNVGIRWLISGTTGEIEVTTPQMLWQICSPGWTLKIKNGSSEAKDVEFSLPKENYPGSFLGINTARLYKAYANDETEKYADFEDGLATHCALQKSLQASK